MEAEDKLKHPDHYHRDGKKDFLTRFEETATKEEFRGAMKFNIGKYVDRYEHKNGRDDLIKAQVYLQRLIDYEENPSKQLNVKLKFDGAAFVKRVEESLKKVRPSFATGGFIPPSADSGLVYGGSQLFFGEHPIGTVKEFTIKPVSSNSLLPVEDKNEQALFKHCGSIDCRGCSPDKFAACLERTV